MDFTRRFGWSDVESSETRGSRPSMDFARRYTCLELRRSWSSINWRSYCYYVEPRSLPAGPCACVESSQSVLPESFVEFAQILEAMLTPFNLPTHRHLWQGWTRFYSMQALCSSQINQRTNVHGGRVNKSCRVLLGTKAPRGDKSCRVLLGTKAPRGDKSCRVLLRSWSS